MLLVFSCVFNICGHNSGREQPEPGQGEKTRAEAELGRSGVQKGAIPDCANVHSLCRVQKVLGT